jgi:integrase
MELVRTVHEPECKHASRWVTRLATNFGCPVSVAEITLASMQVYVGQQAANDTNYLPPRHRTLPILASITPIANYPSKLRIFLTNASRYWQVRCYLKGKTYTQSLKTTNKLSAISLAKQFFHIKTAELYGDRVRARTDRKVKFAELIPAVVVGLQARVKRGEFAAANIPIFMQRMHNSILPYFGDMSMDQIGFKELSAFMEMMSNRDLTATTVHQHMVAIRKVFAHAHGNNIIQVVPKFPVIKVADKPRGSFSLAEYRDLVRYARQKIGERVPEPFFKNLRSSRAIIENYGQINADLQWLIRFMVNGFMRPSDIKFLKHKHVTVVRGKHIYLRLNLPETKRHDKPIVTMQAAVSVYERLLAKQRTQGYGRPDDYLFMPALEDRRWVLVAYGWQFMYIQSLAGIEANAANGQTRTIYSLRHTAMTFRLLYGGKIDLITLARNARTSVEMIERFYSSNLTAEMNIGLLQSKRT